MMLFGALLIGTILLFVLQARVRRDPHTTAGRLFGRAFGVKPSGPGGKHTRREHLLASLASLVGAFAAGTLMVGCIRLSDRLADGPSSTRLLVTVVFGAMLLTGIALLATLLHLASAPFAPASFKGGDAKRAHQPSVRK